jgi:gamma-glutamyltranspeptidase/glutathione hydrolase
MNILLFSLLFFFSFSPSVFAKPQQSAVASAHPLATQAGLDVLAQGGNAFDAAVAVSAALAVVEPAGSGLGGGGFWLLHRASDGFQTMIDGRETAPSQAHRDMYLNADGSVNKQLSLDGPLAAGIPGVPAALAYLTKHYGQLSLKQNLAPAIRYAEQGFPVSAHYLKLATFRLHALRQSPDAAQIILDNGQLPQLGQTIIQTDLARTLSEIADKGRAGFYEGTIAKKLLAGVQQNGGIWTQQDLDNYQIKERKPIQFNYQDYTITSAALPSSGGIVLANIFNQLTALNYHQLAPVDQQHVLIEAMRRAYFDRSRFLGDADFVDVPVAELISHHYAQQHAQTINLQQATQSASLIDAEPKGEDTTHFSIIDSEGNRVSATLSINYPFGSGFIPEGTGVLLNDEMDDFSAKPGTANAYGLVGNAANAIEANKRPLSSMSPSFIENHNKLMVIGTPGGSRIITMVLLGLLDFMEGKSAQQILASPRFHHQYLPDSVQIESVGFDAQRLKTFTDKGHQIDQLSRQYGNMQLVIHNKLTDELSAASDPRGEGLAKVQ